MMFIDTAGLLCLFHAGELEHEDAVTLFNTARVKLTTSYVWAEFVALANARGLPRHQTLEFVAALQDSAEVMVVYVDEALHRAGVNLLVDRLDKHWSLCDSVSIVLMRRRNVTEALTTDHHFEQAGLIRLL